MDIGKYTVSDVTMKEKFNVVTPLVTNLVSADTLYFTSIILGLTYILCHEQ